LTQGNRGNSSGAEFGALQYQQYQGMRLLQGLTPTACGGDGPDGNPVFTNLTPTVPTVPDSPTYADDMLQQLAPGVIQGAGSLGDTSTYAIWYGSSIVGGALMNGAALWQLGSQSTAAAWNTAGTVYNNLHRI
jgi:hypothetical protein